MPIYWNNKSHSLSIGNTLIEKIGGNSITTYSMYGEEPPVIETEDGIEIINKFVLSDYSSWCITDKGNLYTCGQNGIGKLGIPSEEESDILVFTKVATNVKEVYTDCYATAAAYIDASGNLYLCGSNEYGQQGNGESGRDENYNARIVQQFTKRAENVVSACITYNTSWYIDTEGNLYGCGANGDGQQGNGDSGWIETPDYMGEKTVNTFTKVASNVKKVFTSAYGERTFYITNENDLYGTGSGNGYGLGQNTSGSSVFIKIASDVKEIKSTQNTTWYLTNSGDLYGCGRNKYGQQGSGNTTNVTSFVKRASNVKSFEITSWNTWYVTNNNELWGCGQNNKGQLGTGNTTNASTFAKRASDIKYFTIGGKTGTSAIAAYINSKNELFAAGDTQDLGYTTDSKIFVKIQDNVSELYCASQYGANAFIKTLDDKWYCSGDNDNGKLGLGDTTRRTSLVEVDTNTWVK